MLDEKRKNLDKMYRHFQSPKMKKIFVKFLISQPGLKSHEISLTVVLAFLTRDHP
jgi:hypothetical protein